MTQHNKMTTWQVARRSYRPPSWPTYRTDKSSNRMDMFVQ